MTGVLVIVTTQAVPDPERRARPDAQLCHGYTTTTANPPFCIDRVVTHYLARTDNASVLPNTHTHRDAVREHVQYCQAEETLL